MIFNKDIIREIVDFNKEVKPGLKKLFFPDGDRPHVESVEVRSGTRTLAKVEGVGPLDGTAKSVLYVLTHSGRPWDEKFYLLQHYRPLLDERVYSKFLDLVWGFFIAEKNA